MGRHGPAVIAAAVPSSLQEGEQLLMLSAEEDEVSTVQR